MQTKLIAAFVLLAFVVAGLSQWSHNRCECSTETKKKLLIVGDSNVIGIQFRGRKELERLKKKYDVYLYGMTGVTTKKAYLFIKNYDIGLNPDIALFITGPGDRILSRTYAESAEYGAKMKTLYPGAETKIVTEHMLPKDTTDGVHLNAEGYRKLFKKLEL